MITPRILIVDDDPGFLETYAALLGEQGYGMETASSVDVARNKLDDPAGWDIVLLDQKLQGGGGPDSGLALLEEAQLRAPGAKVIVITADATPESVRHAFDHGAYDYVEKTESLPELLRVKVANAWEAVRGYRLAKATAEEREGRIEETWQAISSESDVNKKGALLEELVDLVVSSIDGFRTVARNRRNDIEEIDVVIANESTDPRWSRESPYILIECKNWSRTVGRSELDAFSAKIKRRFGRCKLGLLVSVGGFSGPLRTARAQAAATGDELIALVDAGGFERLIASSDRSDTLKSLVDDAVLATNGN